MMDITWATIFKLIITGGILPLLFVLRDLILRKLTEVFILNDKLQKQIIRYVYLINIQNEKYAKTIRSIHEHGKETKFTLDRKEITEKEYNDYDKKSGEIVELIYKLELKIQKKALIVDRMIAYYKHGMTNPVNKWVKMEKERVKNKQGIMKI